MLGIVVEYNIVRSFIYLNTYTSSLFPTFASVRVCLPLRSHQCQCLPVSDLPRRQHDGTLRFFHGVACRACERFDHGAQPH